MIVESLLDACEVALNEALAKLARLRLHNALTSLRFCAARWPWAHILDLFEEDIFPWPKAGEDMPLPLPAGTCGGAAAAYTRL
jgi:hypothetical protein